MHGTGAQHDYFALKLGKAEILKDAIRGQIANKYAGSSYTPRD